MTTRKDPVGIIGLGYVGLTTAVCFASKGIQTIGVDLDQDKVAGISRAKPPFLERGLADILKKEVKRKRLEVTSDYGELAKARTHFIAVGTPSSDDGPIDLTYVKKAAVSLGGVIRKSSAYNLVVVKSTVTPGTTLEVVRPALESESGKKLGEFGLASNPEFLREGNAIEDTLHPDRLVLGTEDQKSQSALLSFYKRFYGKLPKTILTTTVNAELIKYASNSYLATKISFINEIANLCAKLPGADVSVVAKGMGLDNRIAPGFLMAGLGWGGSCFPKDEKALIEFAESVGVDLGVARAAAAGNEKQAGVAIDLTESLVGDLRGKRIALLGLAFKPDSDDMRDAVSLRLIPELVNRGAEVVAYDPIATENARRVLGDRIGYAKSAKECLTGADCSILVTEWAEFSKLRPQLFKKLMRTPALVDGRRVFERDPFLRSGVKFAAVGLGGRIADARSR